MLLLKPSFKSFALATLSILLLISNPAGLSAAEPEVSRVTVKVTGLRNTKGKVQIRLWNSKNGFPKDDGKAFRRVTVDIVDGGAMTTFADVPFGEYAVSAYHDENSNGKLDTRFPGIPTEGVAVSNDTHKKFGPPPFDSSRFSIREPEKMVPIVIEY